MRARTPMPGKRTGALLDVGGQSLHLFYLFYTGPHFPQKEWETVKQL